MTVPVFRPLLGEPEFAAARAALELGWLGMGSYVSDFETALHKLIGAQDRHVVAVSTGHAALHLALLLVGAGPGDEVITPSFNNIADLQAILATGAMPVFVDIDANTLCVDPAAIEAAITPATKAVIATDYGCHLCDHERIAAIASARGLRVIHDAAHSLGSSYRGRPVGSFSDISMFSFDPVKTVTTIDGGALVVRSQAEVQALHEMRLIGMKQASRVMYENRRAWNYDVERLGFRYHLANLHAAIGLGQLGRFDEIVASRRRLFRFYAESFSGFEGLRAPSHDVEDITPFIYYLRVKADARDAFREFLQSRGVDTGIHWQPAHGFSLFRDCPRGSLEETERVGHEIVTLPFHSLMDEADARTVVAAVRDFFGSA